mmetsp:Transcript_11059/g.36622  ORF Transcript_11059/g.36622 Transcript_11059/m.36622 type:complete len:456 (+) Transcript_11059:99-1466(+)
MSPSHLALLITAISQSALRHSHFGSAAPPRPELRLSAHRPALLRANSRRPRSHTALLSAPAWVPEWLHNGTATLVNRTARLVEKTPLQAAAEPTSNIAIDGGDLWSRARGTREELKEIASLASSTAASAPIIPQYFPQRAWLWRQWSGTIVRRVLPREVIWNTAVACSIALFLTMPGPAWTHPAWRMTLASSLSPLEKVWLLASSLVSFVLSFFLSQAYSVWRNVYSSARRVQGRLNDLGLLCAAFATRDAATGSYTSEAEETLRTVARYVRLFNILFYASVTTQFAPLQSPQGLDALIDLGALTADEKDGLLASAQMHNAVLEWLSNLFDTSVGDGRLGVSVSRLQGTSPIALQMALQNKLVELRSTYASIPDQLSGRMPLAYVQLVQILTDLLIFCTPFALVHSVGGFGAVLGTSVVTLFHSSIVSLAKLFLDPFSNEAPLLAATAAALMNDE